MNIPVFPHSALIDLDSKQGFQDAYRHCPPASSDVVFSCLFGWQNHFNYYYCSFEKFLLVYYMEKNTMVFLPPLLMEGAIEDAEFGRSFIALAGVLERYARENSYDVQFRYIPAVYLRYLPQQSLDITADRDNFDYVYLRQDLVDLAGQKFASKRNLIQQFKSNYSYTYEPVTPKNISGVYDFINQWHYNRSNEMLGEAAYCLACRLLDHYHDLNVIGGILFVGKDVVAAELGTIVDDFLYDDGSFPTAIVHHENALVAYKGAYQMINQLFCAQLPSTVRYVNREEDLGVAGLRKAKESYHPQRMIEKYSIQFKNLMQKDQ